MDIGDVVHRIDPVGQARSAEPRMRRRDQPMLRRQRCHVGMSRGEAVRAVQEQDRRALPGFEHIEFHAGKLVHGTPSLARPGRLDAIAIEVTRRARRHHLAQHMRRPIGEHQDAVGQLLRLQRSWVTSSAAVGRARQALSSSSRLRAAIAGSSDTNGSSSRTSSGSIAKARAMATRRAMPSDSVRGNASLNGARSSVRSRSSTRSGLSVGCASRRFCAHGAPGQQTRLLEHRADARHRGAAPLERTLEVGVETADDPQQRGLAATGRSDQRDDLARAQREIDRCPAPAGRRGRCANDLPSMRSRRITSAIAWPSAPAVAGQPIRSPARPG